MAFIEIDHIFKSFDQTNILKNISFHIERGERFGLIGPNGAGKSTLIGLLTGLNQANSGNIRIDGKTLPKNLVEVRKMIGLVPQELALLEGLNAGANLDYFGGLYGLSGRQLKERKKEALEAVGLENIGKKAVKKFSGGMKRRLNIAAAILHHPQFLILDEPTVGIDPQSRNKIFEFITKMNHDHQMTILYTSHYMEEVENLCERLFIIDEGEEVGYGSQEEIKQMVDDSTKWLIEFTTTPGNIEENLLQEVQGIDHIQQENNQFHLLVDPLTFRSVDLLTFITNHQLNVVTLQKEEISLEESFLRLTGKNLRD